MSKFARRGNNFRKCSKKVLKIFKISVVLLISMEKRDVTGLFIWGLMGSFSDKILFVHLSGKWTTLVGWYNGCLNSLYVYSMKTMKMELLGKPIQAFSKSACATNKINIVTIKMAKFMFTQAALTGKLKPFLSHINAQNISSMSRETNASISI